MVALPTQKSPEWLEEYYKTVGGSTAAASVGLSPFKDLTRSKIGRAMIDPAFRPDLSREPDILRGHFGEPAALWCLSQELQREVQQHDQDNFIYSEDYPHAHSLPDAWAGPQEPCEVKVVRRPTLARLHREGLSTHSTIQCQHTIAILKTGGIHFLALNQEDFKCFYLWVERDDDIILALMKAEAQFKAEVDAGRIPADVPTDDLGLGERPPERVIVTAAEALQAARDFLQAKEALKEAEVRKDELKDELLSYVNGADAFEFQAVLTGTNKEQQGRQGFNHKECVKAHPETEQYYFRGKPFRSLRTHPITG